MQKMSTLTEYVMLYTTSAIPVFFCGSSASYQSYKTPEKSQLKDLVLAHGFRGFNLWSLCPSFWAFDKAIYHGGGQVIGQSCLSLDNLGHILVMVLLL